MEQSWGQAGPELDPFEDRSTWVCITHGRFLPCRSAGPCEHTRDPALVALVRDYQGWGPSHPVQTTWVSFLEGRA